MRVAQTADGLAIEIDSEAEMEELGQALASLFIPDTVVGLVGPLGAGKTRLVKAIAGALGIDPATVTSPTFVLIHEYEGDLPVYHFDAYRLGGPEPFEALGVADYWDTGGICLVEWADLVGELLPDRRWWIAITPTAANTRSIQISGPETSDLNRLREKLSAPI